MIDDKNLNETTSPFKQIYEKPGLISQRRQNLQRQIESTNPTNKKNLFMQERKPGPQKEKELDIKEKEDPTDKLLNIMYLNEIFSKENPKFLENFEFLEPIKAGSAGAVYRAKTKNINKNKERIVACKILPNTIKEKTEKTLIKRHKEVFIHKKFHHKNIPEIYGFYPVGENYSCLMMEFNKYGDLDNFKRKVIKRACLSETLISYLAGGILEALLYINKKKIIHMDIKQQNILIDDFLNIKVTDYSVSLDYGDKKDNYIDLPMVGTCYYMSPEVLSKKRISINDASKIDIYSFGVLLYLLAFNDYPYDLDKIDSHNYPRIYQNIQEKDLFFPKDTGHSEMFKNFVRKCLEKNIKNRYNIYEAMNDPLIKGYQIILNEKEFLYNAGKFMIEVMVDNIKSFNDYIKTSKP